MRRTYRCIESCRCDALGFFFFFIRFFFLSQLQPCPLWFSWRWSWLEFSRPSSLLYNPFDASTSRFLSCSYHHASDLIMLSWHSIANLMIRERALAWSQFATTDPMRNNQTNINFVTFGKSLNAMSTLGNENLDRLLDYIDLGIFRPGYHR